MDFKASFGVELRRRLYSCFSASSDRNAEACKHGPSRGAMEQCCGQAQLAIITPCSSKVRCWLLNSSPHAQREDMWISYYWQALFVNSLSESEPAGREEVFRDSSGGMLSSPGAARSKAERVAKPPRLPGEWCEDLKKNDRFWSSRSVRQNNLTVYYEFWQVRQLQLHLHQERSIRVMLDRAIGRASSTLSPGHRHFPAQVWLIVHLLPTQKFSSCELQLTRASHVTLKLAVELFISM